MIKVGGTHNNQCAAVLFHGQNLIQQHGNTPFLQVHMALNNGRVGVYLADKCLSWK
jgi:hypothetical protein